MRRTPSLTQHPSTSRGRSFSPTEHRSSSTRRTLSPIQYPSSPTHRAPSPNRSTRRIPSPIRAPFTTPQRSLGAVYSHSSIDSSRPPPTNRDLDNPFLNEDDYNAESCSFDALLTRRNDLRQRLARVDSRRENVVDCNLDDSDSGDCEGEFDLRQRLDSVFQAGEEEIGSNSSLDDENGDDFEGVCDLRQKLGVRNEEIGADLEEFDLGDGYSGFTDGVVDLRQTLTPSLKVGEVETSADFSLDNADGCDFEGGLDLRQKLSPGLEVEEEEESADFSLDNADGCDFEGGLDLRQRLSPGLEVEEEEESWTDFNFEGNDSGSESVSDMERRQANRTKHAVKYLPSQSNNRYNDLEHSLTQQSEMETGRSGERQKGRGNNGGRPGSRKRRLPDDRSDNVQIGQRDRSHNSKQQKMSRGNPAKFQRGGYKQHLSRYPEKQQEVHQQGNHPTQGSREINTPQARGGHRNNTASHAQGELDKTHRRGNPSERPSGDPMVAFMQKVSDIPLDSAPDTLCMFLAQHQHNLARALMDPCLHNREVTDKLLAMLRKAFNESTLCDSSSQQVMEMLTSTGFFESGLAIAIVKSLITTKHCTPDESNVFVVDNMLEVMSKMIDARILSTEDTVVFTGSLQAALRTSLSGAGGREDIVDLKNKVQFIESKARDSHIDVTSRDVTMDADDATLDPLGPILPDITKIRIADLRPRNLLDTFSSATEYVRYVFQVYREDFIGPLIEGVHDYMDYIASCKRKGSRGKPKYRNQNVRLYENVQVIDTSLSSDIGIDVTICIDMRSSLFRKFHSRLIYGSLVCLSCDSFQNVIYATVSDRDKLQTEGLLNIHILHNEHIHRYGNSDFNTEDLDEKDDDRRNRYRGNKNRDGRLNTIIGTFVNPSGMGDFGHSRSADPRFSMLESTVYFTPYMHTLLSLKALYFRVSRRQDSLPFKRQLLELSKERRPPRCHEASDGHVSFTCMMDYARKAVAAADAAIPDDDVQKEVGVADKEGPNNPSRRSLPSYRPTSPSYSPTSPSYSPTAPYRLTSYCAALVSKYLKIESRQENLKRKEKIVKEMYKNNAIGQPSTWPSAELLGLDDSQYSALQMALTHNVALIQGPPGIGKTLLGLRIAELLLKNQQLWRTDNNGMMDKAPLLLLSFTNHALDQFLIAILSRPCAQQYTISDVVRAGSRSEHEQLDAHNISRLRKRQNNPLENEKTSLADLRGSRQLMNDCLDKSHNNLVHLSNLCGREVICQNHAVNLWDQNNDSFPRFLRWLCLDRDDLGRSLDLDRRYHHNVQGSNRRHTTVKRAATHPTKHESRTSDLATRTNDVLFLNNRLNQTAGPSCEDMAEGELKDDADTVDMEGNSIRQDKNGYDVGSCEEELDNEEEYKRWLDLEEDSDDETRPLNPNEPSTSHRDPQKSKARLQHNMMRLNAIEEQHSLLKGMFYALTEHCPSKSAAVRQKVLEETNSGDLMTEDEENAVKDVWLLDATQRWRLYRLWLQRVRDQIRCLRETEEAAFEVTSKRVEELRSMTDLNIMRQARVVAMTTTAAARYSAVLRHLGPRVIIVEEAAQVPEAHIVSALSSSCDHLIMIGDHQQLRPSYSNYSLTLHRQRHFIDISLFERLCRAGLPFSRLALQHRMRPEISKLLVPTIYSHLKDDTSVLNFPNIRGVGVNLFFLNHSYPENTTEESKSKRNTHEAEVLKSLYRYLRLQGYSEKDITVLALYKDQVLFLKSLIKKVEQTDPLISRPEVETCLMGYFDTRRGKRRPKPTGARVTAVDNFQGEESKIVLLSLVRSNKEGRIGYLAEANRVCVALSRAQQGLYVIGNCTMLKNSSPKCWKPILQIAEDSGSLGETLPLRCSRHDVVTHIATSSDIDQCRNGGCTSKCNFRRRCGHTCEEICHDPNLFHDDYCKKPCVKKCRNGHTCKGLCSEVLCPPCEENCVKKCRHGHECDKKCWEECAPCRSRCEKKLTCGHQCQSRCGENCTDECKDFVKVTGVCGHEFQTMCGTKDNASCTVPCGSLLSCGHQCPGKCGHCFAGRVHVACRKDCQRVLVCGHTCKAKCAKSCPPCQRKCDSECVHSPCSKKCGEVCTPCVEPCAWRCKPKCRNRISCKKLCSEVCDRPRCDEPCRSRHQCGSCKKWYVCRGLFCESSQERPCPPACPTCNKDIFEIFFGTEDEHDARFYKMTDCDCVLEVTGLDQYMDGDSESVGNKTCPKCKSPVLKAQRYRQVLNKTAGTVEKVKQRLLKEACSDDTKTKVLAAVHILMTKFKGLATEFSLFSAGRPTEDSQRLAEQVNKYLSTLKEWAEKKRYFFSEQELGEFQAELIRGDITVTLFTTQKHLATLAAPIKEKERIQGLVQTFTDRVLKDMKVLSQEEIDTIRQTIKEAKKLSGLGVSNEERLMVLKAMNFSKGHWYRCKNGHVYCIGECGGAMEQSRCPECGEAVGGGQHRLAEGNSVATEMDGARYGAWSEQANLENYDVRDIL